MYHQRRQNGSTGGKSDEVSESHALMIILIREAVEEVPLAFPVSLSLEDLNGREESRNAGHNIVLSIFHPCASPLSQKSCAYTQKPASKV